MDGDKATAEDDYEWDPSKSLATAWSKSTAASKATRGRRAYGRRSGATAAVGTGTGTGAGPGVNSGLGRGGGVARHRKKRALRQRWIHELQDGTLDLSDGEVREEEGDEGEGNGGFNASAALSDSSLPALDPMPPPAMRRSTVDFSSSVSNMCDRTGGTSSPFDLPPSPASSALVLSSFQRAQSSVPAESLPPPPPPLTHTDFGMSSATLPPPPRRACLHARSKSVSVNRQPVSSSWGVNRRQIHQRSASVSLSGCSRSSSAWSSTSCGGGFGGSAISDRENFPPNLSSALEGNGEDVVFSPCQPTKIKRLQLTPHQPPRPPPFPTPPSSAPSGWPSAGRDDFTPTFLDRKGWGYTGTGGSGGSGGGGARRRERKKTRADEVLDQMPKPPSLTPPSLHSSFTSLSKTGDLAPTWARNTLHESLNKWNSSPSLASAGRAPLQTGSFGATAADLMSTFASPAKAQNSEAAGAYSSPSRSPATFASTSSRKRVVCDSPNAHKGVDCDDDDVADGSDLDADACDLSSVGGLSSIHSRGGGSVYRSRARSRIFSPDSAQKNAAAAAAAAVTIDSDYLNGLRGGGGGGRGRQKDDDDDSDESSNCSENDSYSESSRSDEERSDAHSEGGAESDTEFKNDGEGEEDVSFPIQLSVRRSVSDSFPESVFGAVDAKGTPTRGKSIGGGDVWGSRDRRSISFPVQVAKGKKKGGAVAKAAARTGGREAGAVDGKYDVLDSVSSYEDLKFLIKALRRSVRTGVDKVGSGLLAVAGSMGCTIVLPQSWPAGRRSLFVFWVTKSLGFSLRSAGGAVSYLQATAEKAGSILKLLEGMLVEHKRRLALEAKGDADEAAIPALASTHSVETAALPMMGLGCFSTRKKLAVALPETPLIIVSAPNRTGANSFADIVSPLDRDVEGDLLDTMISLSITEDSQRQGNEEDDKRPLVAARAENNCGQLRSSTLPCFRTEMSESPKDSSFEHCRPPRHSGEHSICVDIMKHIHGASPVDVGERPPPPRLAIPTRTPIDGATVSRFSSDLSHHPSSVCAKHTPSFDIAETPLPPRSCQMWGSRPILGRDWGESTKCDDVTIAILVKRYDTAVADAELCGQSPMLNRTSPRGMDDKDVVSISELVSQPMYPSSSCFLNPNISQTAVNSAGLGFDFEADNDPHLDACNEDIVASNESGLEDREEGIDDDRFDVSEGGPRRFSCPLFESANLRRRPYNRRMREGSVGASSLVDLDLSESDWNVGTPLPLQERIQRRRQQSFAKHKRISLCGAALDTVHAHRLSANRFTLGGVRKVEIDTFSLHGSFTVIQSDCPVFPPSPSAERERSLPYDAVAEVLNDNKFLALVLAFLREEELMCTASLVCSSWADAAMYAHASLSLVSVGCSTSFIDDRVGVNGLVTDVDDSVTDDGNSLLVSPTENSIAKSMEKGWEFLMDRFPCANFLSEGAYKRVYKVWNETKQQEEAISVMDFDKIDGLGNNQIVGNELAMSVLLSSLVRRGICPNFVLTRGIFNCSYEPPASHWGCAEKKRPEGAKYVSGRYVGRKPREPAAKFRGRFQYIRMELCKYGDVEEFIKEQPGQVLDPCEARNLFFQMAFSLHVARDRFGMKHYDVKLLNFFLQSANSSNIDAGKRPRTIIRYGIGSHVFRLQMSTTRALIAKLADYGTANMSPETNGQPVTLGQFTTLENSPADFLFLGDAAVQGFGHDCFGLGLCMLHLFTGRAPYEEIMEDVFCPPSLKQKLRKIWEEPSSRGYGVIRSVILADVYEDENGNTEGEPDEVLYDTLYRYLVLFGIPEEKFKQKEAGRVWRAISSTIEASKNASSGNSRPKRKARAKKEQPASNDEYQYLRDRNEFSLSHGAHPCIVNARENLIAIDGGMDLLLSLVSFDPERRATPLDVINSTFMAPLREEPGMTLDDAEDIVHSFMSYAH